MKTILLDKLKDGTETRKAGYSERLSAQTYFREMVVLTSMLQRGIWDHYRYCYR